MGERGRKKSSQEVQIKSYSRKIQKKGKIYIKTVPEGKFFEDPDKFIECVKLDQERMTKIYTMVIQRVKDDGAWIQGYQPKIVNDYKKKHGVYHITQDLTIGTSIVKRCISMYAIKTYEPTVESTPNLESPPKESQISSQK